MSELEQLRAELDHIVDRYGHVATEESCAVMFDLKRVLASSRHRSPDEVEWRTTGITIDEVPEEWKPRPASRCPWVPANEGLEGMTALAGYRCLLPEGHPISVGHVYAPANVSYNRMKPWSPR